MNQTFKQFLFETNDSGFKYKEEIEREEDNKKIWHYITTPDGKEHTINMSPYKRMDDEMYQLLVTFYKKYKRFPSRKDVGGIGTINKDNLKELIR